MAVKLTGKEVAAAMTEVSAKRVEELKQKGVTPTLAIVRVGEKSGDLAYERGALKRAEKTGVRVEQFLFAEDVTQKELTDAIHRINRDDGIHGVLLFRPLPSHLDEAAICEELAPAKDMDGITAGSMSGVFMGTGEGYPPCTAEACMAMLDHYGVELEGRRVTIMGRSLVIGRPVAMMAMKRNATITILHSRTRKEDFARAGREADVVIAALGRAKMIGKDRLGEGQVILDVGINVDEEGHLCGDVDYDAVAEKASMITPVPGGVGNVTTAVLMNHVVRAAEKTLK